jgi:hypothetical protein
MKFWAVQLRLETPLLKLHVEHPRSSPLIKPEGLVKA